MPALHPDARRLLETIRLAGRPAFETLSPLQAREVYAAGRLFLQPPPADVPEARTLSVEGPGGPVPVRLYRGEGAAAVSPALLYLHGGGWVVGSLDSHDGVCRRLANLLGARVVAADYRLAPEHRFPAALEDATAVLGWMAGNAAELGIDAARIAVGGDSAGGTLAAVLALMGRDGNVPPACFQMLLYPATDLRMDTPSYARVKDLPLTGATMRWFVGHYAPDPAARADWRASPALVPSLAGTPPAFVLTVGHDPLCDEGRAYAARLEADGVSVTALHLAAHIHGMLTMGRVIGAADDALQCAAAALRDAWR